MSDQDTVITKGGAEMTVKLENGQSDNVKVKLLPLCKIPDFFASLDDDIKMIMLVTGRSRQYAEAVDFESGLDLIEKAHEVNFQRAERWAERKAKVMGPLINVAQKGQSLQQRLTAS